MALQNEEIAARLRELRKARGNPPQDTVAAELGVGDRTYQTWENAEAKPSYRSLQKLADYFGVGEDFILSGTGRVTPDPFAGQSQLDRIERKLDDLAVQVAMTFTLLELVLEDMNSKDVTARAVARARAPRARPGMLDAFRLAREDPPQVEGSSG